MFFQLLLLLLFQFLTSFKIQRCPFFLDETLGIKKSSLVTREALAKYAEYRETPSPTWHDLWAVSRNNDNDNDVNLYPLFKRTYASPVYVYETENEHF